FFFSSRRRHTRLQGDWSSDVCSSDLATASPATSRAGRTLSAPIMGRLHCGGDKIHVPVWELVLSAPSMGRLHCGGIALDEVPPRSEERRVGKEGGARWGEGAMSKVGE